MRFTIINKPPERAFGAFRNVSGDTIFANTPVAFATGAGSNDGLNAVPVATGNLATFAGIVVRDVADTKMGSYQAYGQRNSIRIFAHATSVTIGAGVAIGPGPGSGGLGSTGLVTAFGPVVTMGAAGAALTSGGGYVSGFIRAL